MKPTGTNHHSPISAELKRVALLGSFEAATLIALICIAVPIKYLLGQPAMVKLMGPVHGLAFLIYLWTLLHHAMTGTIARKDALMLGASAFVPFGFFFSRKCITRTTGLREQRP